MDGYRHRYTIEVRFRDLDALGHVNNAVYFTYLETARIAYVREVLYGDVQLPLTAMQVILAEIGASFRRPVYYGQRLVVGTRTVALGRSSYRLENRIEADGQLATLAQGVMVHFDYATGRSVPIPPDVRARVARFEGIAEEDERQAPPASSG